MCECWTKFAESKKYVAKVQDGEIQSKEFWLKESSAEPLESNQLKQESGRF